MVPTEKVETYDWDDELGTEVPVEEKYTLLEEGDYPFIVTKFERGRFPGSDKLPPANKATITLQITGPKNLVYYTFDLLLIKLDAFEKRLYGFFRAIGQKKYGEASKMNWNVVVDSYGKAHFKPKTITTKNGETKEVNDLVYFIDRYKRDEDQQLELEQTLSVLSAKTLKLIRNPQDSLFLH